MSKAGNTFGTQSPPLESTGEQEPLGVSSIRGDKPKAVPDKVQRQEYFKDDDVRGAGDDKVSEKTDAPREKLKTD